MTRPSIVNTISLGNIIQIGAFVVALALGYATIQKQGESNAEKIVRVEALAAANDLRLRTLESRDARNEERWANILQFLNRIDSRLERIEQVAK